MKESPVYEYGMALAIAYAWSTSVHMQYSLQTCTQSKVIAYPLNMHIKFALHAEEIRGASGMTSAQQQSAVTLQTHPGVCNLQVYA